MFIKGSSNQRFKGICAAILNGVGFLGNNALGYADATLPMMTVTASRPALDQYINKPQVLEEADLSIAHERTLGEVIKGFPGISLTQGGGFGQQTAVQIRGAGGQGVMTLDDIPLLQAMPGLQNLDSLPVETLGSVEIERGPSAAYHAFQALGGAIRLYTQDRENTGAKVSLEGGSFGILRETLQGTVAGAPGRMTLTLSRGDAFDGGHLADAASNPERDPFKYTQGILRFSSDLNSRINWQGSLLYNKTRISSDGIGLDPHYRVAFQDDPHSIGAGETWLAQNSLNMKLTPTWDSHLQLGFTKVQGISDTTLLKTSVAYHTFLANLRNQHTLVDNAQQQFRWQLQWGAQGRQEQGEGQPAGFNEERTLAAGFVDTEARYRNVSGQIGVRVEHFDRFGEKALFKAAAAWQLSPALTLRASGGTGYRLPSYSDLLTLYFGNLNLKPERSASGTLSLAWNPLNNLQINLSGYYNRYDDLILQAYNPQRGPTTDNIADAEVTGMELDTQYAWTDTLDTGLSYAYSDSRDLQSNRRLPFRPPHTLRVWGKQRLASLPVSLWAEAIVRSASWNDTANTIALDQSLQLNAAIRYTVSRHFELYLRGENLTNNRTPQYYSLNEPGIAVYGGLQLTY